MDYTKYNNLRYKKIFRDTITDGYGLRISIYFTGCNHRCSNCHNEETTWDPTSGDLVDEQLVDKLGEELSSNPLLAGITLSGGDPFYNPEGLEKFLIDIRKYLQKHQTIWVYTGYLYEELLDDKQRCKLLSKIDYLVDGRFQESKADPTLAFRGSTNQRIIKLIDKKEK